MSARKGCWACGRVQGGRREVLTLGPPRPSGPEVLLRKRPGNLPTTTAGAVASVTRPAGHPPPSEPWPPLPGFASQEGTRCSSHPRGHAQGATDVDTAGAPQLVQRGSPSSCPCLGQGPSSWRLRSLCLICQPLACALPDAWTLLGPCDAPDKAWHGEAVGDAPGVPQGIYGHVWRHVIVATGALLAPAGQRSGCRKVPAAHRTASTGGSAHGVTAANPHLESGAQVCPARSTKAPPDPGAPRPLPQHNLPIRQTPDARWFLEGRPRADPQAAGGASPNQP